MAEQRGSNRRNGTRGKLSAREAVERVRADFPALLGRPIESVLSVQRADDDDDGWQVTVQVIELARIPRTTDVLGAYAVTIDKDGEVLEYRRRRRYNRSQTDED
jgi:Gas vesicle synthesis protein GvpO